MQIDSAINVAPSMTGGLEHPPFGDAGDGTSAPQSEGIILDPFPSFLSHLN